MIHTKDYQLKEKFDSKGYDYISYGIQKLPLNLLKNCSQGRLGWQNYYQKKHREQL